MQREYIKYYLSQTGHGLGEVEPLLELTPTFQRGRGIGNVFATLFRFLKPVLSSGLNLIKDEAIKTGTNILTDITSGADLKEAIQNQSRVGLKNLQKNTVNQLHAMYGGNIKNKITLLRKKKTPIKRRNKKGLAIVAKCKNTRKGNKKQKKFRTLDIFN